VCEMVTCANCGEAKSIKAKGLCNACYLYWYKHGKPRPDTVRKSRNFLCTTCRNCGEQKTPCVRGLCRACYWYYRRHGKHRTKSTSPYRGTTACRNCGAEGHCANGLCSNCYNFLRRTGKMRTEADMHYKVKGMCKNCNQSPVFARNLCSTCYEYQRNHGGAARPRRLFACRERCKNCDTPLNGNSDKTRRTKNMCRACYDYKRRHGDERPAHLWGKGEHGWCDCGQPATRTIEIKITRNVDVLPVCESCYAEEMRQRRIYGDVTQRVGVNQQHSTR
jgi:hypothetical protein